MEWQKINGFPNYSVSDDGGVRNDKFNRPLSYSKHKAGLTTYLRVTLFIDGVRYYRQVHRLVAEAFIPNPLNLPQVDHKDNNGLNNMKDNLQWFTGTQNVQKSFEQNPHIKIQICRSGGLLGGARNRVKSEIKYRRLLGDRFIAFHPSEEIIKDACISYLCACGIARTASIMWKELRNHEGKCPQCTGTIKQSSPSLR